MNFLKKFKKYRSSRKPLNESLAYLRREKDPIDNARTTPSEEENLDLHCAWMTEAFTPSTIDTLTRSLRRLHWEYPETPYQEDNLIEWIKKGRSYSNRRSWKNVGVILKNKDTSTSFIGEIRRCKLPKGVNYCNLSIENITPSITTLTIQFVFDRSRSDSLNEKLKQSHQTKIKKVSAHRWHFLSPSQQKRALVQTEIKAVNKNLSRWMSNQLPGYFTSKKIDLPMIWLLTSKTYKSDGKTKNPLKETYIDLLFDRSGETWLNKEISGLEFKTQLSEEKSFGILFGNFTELTKEEMNFYGGPNREGLVNKFDQIIGSTTSIWATHHLLSSYENQLAKVRDEAIAPIQNAKKTIKNLNNLRSKFLSTSNDIQVTSEDLKYLTSTKKTYSVDCINFEPKEEYLKSRYDFHDYLRSRDMLRIKSLENLGTIVRLAVNSNGDLVSAITNLSIQRYIFWLTLITIGLALYPIFKDYIAAINFINFFN